MTETIEFPIRGMTCSSCVGRITRALRRLEGVGPVRVDLGREVATVTHDPARAPVARLADAVARAGYAAEVTAATPVAAPKTSLLGRLFGRRRRGQRSEMSR